MTMSAFLACFGIGALQPTEGRASSLSHFPLCMPLTLCGAGWVPVAVQMLQTAHALKVLLWSSVVDMIAPQGHKQQQQQQQPQQANRGISRLLGWAGRGGSGSNSSSNLAASQHSQQQQHGATGSSGAEAGSSSSSGPSAVDPALLLKGVDVLLLDLQADLPLMYRCEHGMGGQYCSAGSRVGSLQYVH